MGFAKTKGLYSFENMPPIFKPQLVGALIAVVLFAGCEEPRKNQFRDEFRWISGKWKGEFDGRTVIETWSWEKHRFEGTGMEIEEGDTVFAERLYLEEHQDNYSYIAVLEGRPPILFAGSYDSEEKEWTFENPEHDFPSRILYQRQSDSTLVISIKGPRSADNNGFSYTLKRTR